MKKLGQLGISIGLTVLVGYLIYISVPDWGEAWRVMLQGDPLFLLGGYCFTSLHMVLRAWRWGVLLSPVKQGISYRNLFSLTFAKYTINIIPPRAGEVVASVVLAKKERVAATSVIAASILERILDTLTVVVIFGFYMAFLAHRYAPNSDRGSEILLAVQKFSVIGFFAMVAGFVFLGFLLRDNNWLRRVPKRLHRFILPFLEGFRALQHGSTRLKAAALSLGIWITITFQMWLMVLAYLDTFPFAGALFLMAITVVGVAIPTPGGVGGFQFFMNLALVHFFAPYLSLTDPASQAAGISNGCYIVSMIPTILIGLFFVNREGLSFGQISELADEKKPQPGVLQN